MKRSRWFKEEVRRRIRRWVGGREDDSGSWVGVCCSLMGVDGMMLVKGF